MRHVVNPKKADSRGGPGHSVKRSSWFSRRVLGAKLVLAGIMALLVAAMTVLPVQADPPRLTVEYSSTGKGYLAYGGEPLLAYGPGDEMRIIQGGPANVTRWADWQRDNGMNLIRAYPTVMPLSAYGSAGPHPFHSAGGGKWNVDAFNDAYFDAMGAVASALEERGIVLHLQLFSHWPFKGGSSRWDICYVNPNNNVNSWTNGFTSGDHYLGAYTTAARNHQRIWIEKILNAMKGRGNVFIDICNEVGGTGTSIGWAAERAGWIREWEAENDWSFIVGVGGGHTTYGSHHNSFDIFIHNELRTVSRVRDSIIATGKMPAVSVRSSDGTNNWGDYMFASADQVGPEHQTRYRTLCYRSIFAGLQSIGAYWKMEVSQSDYLNMQHWPVYARALRSFWDRIGPYWPELEPDDSIISNAVTPYAYALKSDQVYVVYLECGSHTHNKSYPSSTVRIECPFDLNALEVELFNPRNGSSSTGQATRVGTQLHIPLPSFIDDYVVILYQLDTEPPSVPTDVQATSRGSTVMDITWTASTDNIGVEGYRIHRNGTAVGTTSSTYYMDTGLTPSTTYSYTVSAYDARGNESAQSHPPTEGTTLAPDSEPPSVPTNVNASPMLSGLAIQISWTASTDNRGVIGYKIFRNGAHVGTTGDTGYIDDGLSAGTTYSYTVSAYDGDGNESAESEPAVATTVSAMYISPSADSFTRMNRADTNYGTDPVIEVKAMSDSAARCGWFRFTFGVTPATDASFRIYQVPGSVGYQQSMRLRGLDVSFNETQITWNNQPGGTNLTWGTLISGPADWAIEYEGWRTIDITTFYNNNLGKTVSLRLRCETQTTNMGVTLNSREASTNQPYIEVCFVEAAVITIHPLDETKSVGETATFSVTALGSPAPTYQWQVKPSGGDWENIVGATSESYTTPVLVAADDGNQYRCVATNSHGSDTSNSATLTVYTPPSIIEHPISQTVCEGDSVTFTVTATGTEPLSYQWMKDSQDEIIGATSSSYTIDSVSWADVGSYHCKVTNIGGITNSDGAVLMMNTLPTITVQPQSVLTSEGSNVTFVIEAAGSSPLSYQWRKNEVEITGAEDSSYTIYSVGSGDSGSYDCVVTNICGSVTSAAATLTVTLPINPLGVSNREIGGGDYYYDPATKEGQRGVTNSVGLNTIGLLIRTSGEVTYAASDYFYIDDGSGLDDGSGHFGVKVVLPPGLSVPAEGSYVVVTGVSSCYKTEDDVHPQIKVRQESDVTLAQ